MFTSQPSLHALRLALGTTPEEQADPLLSDAPLSERERQVAELIYRQLRSYFVSTDIRALHQLFMRIMTVYAANPDAARRYGPEFEAVSETLLLYADAVDLWQWLFNHMTKEVQAVHLTS